MNACSETAILSYKRHSYNHVFTRVRGLRSIRAVRGHKNKVLEEKENRLVFETTGQRYQSFVPCLGILST